MTESRFDTTCRFCNLKTERIIAKNDAFIVIPDGFPVNKGHTLVISRKHVATLFNLTTEEFTLLNFIIRSAKDIIDDVYKPDGYNIGANCGEVAGQTVMHFHLHVIPRYKGDVENPRGGVRNIKIPLVPY